MALQPIEKLKQDLADGLEAEIINTHENRKGAGFGAFFYLQILRLVQPFDWAASACFS